MQMILKEQQELGLLFQDRQVQDSLMLMTLTLYYMACLLELMS